MNKNTILDAANAIMDEITEIRRDIHKNPELGFQETRTSALIREKLTEYGVDKLESPAPTAVIGYICGGRGKGRTVALRADIDALPVEEATGLPYSSQVPGVMHACGHDMHASMLLGVAKLLCEKKDEFAGTVKLIFQHSEDTLPGGAKELVEKGVMEDVDAIFGMHVFPTEGRPGEVAFHAGPVTTSVDLFEFEIVGKGGHGSAPHTTHDPVLTGAQLVMLLQQIPARYVDPLETVVFPVSTFHSGEAVNVIPAKAKLAGVARSYQDSVREDVNKQVYDIIKGLEAISSCKINVEHYEGYPACYNDEGLTDLAMKAVGETVGEDRIIYLDKPLSFSEDFSYYSKMAGVPGCYIMLHAGHEGDELVSLHNPKFAVKEEAMPYGIAVMTNTALAYLAE